MLTATTSAMTMGHRTQLDRYLQALPDSEVEFLELMPG